MSYYESVETVTFTRARALIELQNHGIPESEYPVFFFDMGDKSHYKAQAVLEWLMY